MGRTSWSRENEALGRVSAWEGEAAAEPKHPARQVPRPPKLWEESKDGKGLFVQELPHAVEQGVTHRMLTAADFAAHFHPGQVFIQGDLIVLGNVGAADADPGIDDRLGLVVIVFVRDRFGR